jgi:hypothetical protein
MTRHLTWTCPDCGEICECTDAACQCQLDAEDRENEDTIEAIFGDFINGAATRQNAIDRLDWIGEDEAERVVDEWAEGKEACRNRD